jgi:hypothetical protein
MDAQAYVGGEENYAMWLLTNEFESSWVDGRGGLEPLGPPECWR